MMKTLLRHLFTCAACTFLLVSCATTPTTLNYYDFGTAAKQRTAPTLSCHLPPVNLTDITTPRALDSNLMLYRLLYANEQQTHAYANHRWSMAPAQLLAQRIKAQLADNGVTLIDNGIHERTNRENGLQLRLELTDFSHYFSNTTQSYAQLTMRATLLRARTLLAQTTLQKQANAEATNAPAGAQAMRVAADDLIVDLTAWLCKQAQP